MQLGHNMTLLHELEEEDIASFKYYIRMDPNTFNAILKRITPRIKKLTTNYKDLHVSNCFLATGNSSKCISYSFRVYVHYRYYSVLLRLVSMIWMSLVEENSVALVSFRVYLPGKKYTWILKIEECCWRNDWNWHRQIYFHQKLQE